MPIYEYKCEKCGKRFDHLVRNLSESTPKCPKCGASKPKKQLSSFSTGNSNGSDSLSCPTDTCSTGTCSLD